MPLDTNVRSGVLALLGAIPEHRTAPGGSLNSSAEGADSSEPTRYLSPGREERRTKRPWLQSSRVNPRRLFTLTFENKRHDSCDDPTKGGGIRSPVARRLAANRKRGHGRRPYLAFLAATLVAALWPASALAAPANDDFANAQVITGLTGSVSSTNIGATSEIGEPDHAGNPGGHSIWYSWTAPADGNVAFTTLGSAFDTLLAVYTGAAVGALTLVAANDDDPGAGGVSTVSFAVSNGLTYKVAVDGFSGKVGSVNLHWHPSPANDNFAEVQVLPSTSSGTVTGDSRGATLEPGEPARLLFGPGTVWYSWTAPADGTYKFDTFGSNFDTVLAVYAGSSLDALDLVRINDDDPDRGCCSSWVPIANTTSGTTYSIAVLPFEDSTGGHVVLRWSPLILGGSAGETATRDGGRSLSVARGA